MDLKSGTPYSLVKNGLMFNYPKLESDLVADVVVIGGGISGALVAYYLTTAGVECAVVDARLIGHGSTCASTSLLQYEIDVPLCQLQHKVGYENAVRSYKLGAQAIMKLQELATDVGLKNFQLKNSLYFAGAKKDVALLRAEYDIRKKNGLAVTFLEQDSIEKLFGFKAPAAILSELGAQTDAYSFTHALHQFNIKNGCKVFDRSTVKKIDHGKDAVLLTTDNKKRIKAKYLVYATGYESVNYIKKKIATLNSTYAIISENRNHSESFWYDDAIMWNTSNPYLYLRTTKDGRTMIGGRDENFYNPEKRDKLLAKKARELKKDFLRLFPNIGFNIDYCWTGTFASTKDGLPFIGPYKPLANSFFALGYGGNGITFSQIAGEIIADLIMGKGNQDAKIFGFERA